MEYEKIITLSVNTQNEPSKFRTRNWVKINGESRAIYNKDNQIKFRTSMIRSNFCDYSDAYILVSGTITIDGAGEDNNAKGEDERNKGVTFKNCASFTECITNINNTQIDNAKDIDVMMPMYNLIEYSDNYSKTSGSLLKYYRDDPNDNIAQSETFKSKIKVTVKNPADSNTKIVEIVVSLEYLSNFWTTLEMALINCEISLDFSLDFCEFSVHLKMVLFFPQLEKQHLQ